MPGSRFVLHPVLLNKRSRLIFIWFLMVSILIGGAIYWKFQQILSQADVLNDLRTTPLKWYLSVLLSPHFKVTLVLASAALAGAITAHYVVGPVRRIEQWIKDWKSGLTISELRVRQGDKFTTLVRILNDLHAKFSHSKRS
ncbi:hypothetical protein BVX98_06425 [bacterium F11]|nr:hypothetical protein BVX98_06425 [bacterium F11]